MIPHPVRVPSVVPGRWIYLRAWDSHRQHDGTTAGHRSHGSFIWVVSAGEHFAAICADGLEPVDLPDAGSFAANAAAVDAYLVSLGAEVVPPGEWPDPWKTEEPRGDRRQLSYSVDDLDALAQEMRRRGYDGPFDRTAKPGKRACPPATS